MTTETTTIEAIKPITVDCSKMRILEGVSAKQIDYAMRLRTVKIENAIHQANRTISQYQSRTDSVGRDCAKAYKQAFWAAFIKLASNLSVSVWIETDPLSMLHFEGEDGVKKMRAEYWAAQKANG